MGESSSNISLDIVKTKASRLVCEGDERMAASSNGRATHQTTGSVECGSELYSKVNKKEKRSFSRSVIRGFPKARRILKRKRCFERLTSSDSGEEADSSSSDVQQSPRTVAPGPPTSNAEPNLRDFIESFFQETFLALEGLRTEMADQRALLETLTLRVVEISNDRPFNPAARRSLPDGFQFPIAVLEDLIRLNSYLEVKENREQLMRYVISIGGDSVKDWTRRVMQRLMSNSLAMSFNMTGAKGKLALNSFTHFKDAIVDGIRYYQSDTTENEVIHFVTAWLSSARDRDGGRARRAIRPAETSNDQDPPPVHF